MPEQNKQEYGPAAVPFSAYLNKEEKLEDTEKELEEMRKKATTDALSGALNRHGLEVYLETAAVPKAMLIVDATNFKAVNDIYGYPAGDKLIVDTYGVLRESVRPSDIVARWGGDEFVIILNGEAERDQPTEMTEDLSGRRASRTGDLTPEGIIEAAKARIAERVKELLAHNQTLTEVNFNLAVGGIVWNGGENLQQLISQAEAELKKHKTSQHESGQYRRS